MLDAGLLHRLGLPHADGHGQRRARAELPELSAGHDSYNLLIPSDTSRFNTYIASRGHQSAGGVGIEKADLVSITEKNPLVSGQSYGLHPQASALAGLFNAGNLAFVVNTGTLVQPMRSLEAASAAISSACIRTTSGPSSTSKA